MNAAIQALFLVMAAVQGGSEARSSTWRLADVQCTAEDSPTAIVRVTANSDTHCAILADQKSPTGALVAQFHQLARTCAIFNYQSICRDLIAGQSPSCAVFFRFPIDHRSMNAKLNNVWLADDVSRLENLVCQADEDTNRLHPVGVEWSSEGAVFDGEAAHAVLNKSSIGFATGITWLLRIKRQSQVQPFIEFTDCGTLGSAAVYSTHMWEHDFPRRVYMRLGKVTGTLLDSVFSPQDLLSAVSTDWMNIGFTASSDGGAASEMFYMDSFLPKSKLIPNSESDIPMGKLCMYFGRRIASPTNWLFNGTLRALAFASVEMSEEEIRKFFSLIE